MFAQVDCGFVRVIFKFHASIVCILSARKGRQLGQERTAQRPCLLQVNGRDDRSKEKSELQPEVRERSDLLGSGVSKRTSDFMAVSRWIKVDQLCGGSAVLLGLDRR